MKLWNRAWRYLEQRGKFWRSIWLAFSAVGSLFNTVGNLLKAGWKRDKESAKMAREETKEIWWDTVTVLDNVVSWTIWTARETVWAVLQAKWWAAKKLTVNDKFSKKMWPFAVIPWIWNRLITMTDTWMDIVGDAAIWVANIVDNWIWSLANRASESSSTVDNFKEKSAGAIKNIFVDDFWKWFVVNGFWHGKSRFKPDHYAYASSRREYAFT